MISQTTKKGSAFALPMMVERRGFPLLRLKARSSRPLADLIQAGFDHRLLERSTDVLAHADALSGSNPLLLFIMKSKRRSNDRLLISWWSVGDSNP